MSLPKSLIVVFILGVFGCGKSEPSKSVEVKPGEKKDDAPIPTPSGPGASNPGGPMAPAMPGPALLAPTDPVQQAAEKFVTDLLKASSAPLPQDLMDRISPTFLKVIGKPLLSEADKKAGYSSETAQAWLRRAGSAMNGVGPPTGYGSPSAAVFVGTSIGGGPRFLLRMVQTDGGWKAAWFELGTVKTPDVNTTSTDGPYQDFAVLAFLDALTGNASSKEDRTALLGGLLSAKLKTVWAEPFQQDKDRGSDYSAKLLAEHLDKLGGASTGFTRTPIEGDTAKIELMKGEAKTIYTLKLVKGAAPGEWLVDEFTKQ
jgi:hypothetical protein